MNGLACPDPIVREWPPRTGSALAFRRRAFTLVLHAAQMSTQLANAKVASVRNETSVDPSALRAARERAGLTQHQLARLIDVAGGERISAWEQGRSAPRPEVLLRLATTLKTTPFELLRTNPLGPDLRALRLAAGLSVSTMCGQIPDLTPPTYTRWESGRWTRVPDATRLQALGVVLGVPPTVLRTAFERTRQGA